MHGSIVVVTIPPPGNPRANAETLIPGVRVFRKFCPGGFPGVKSKTRIQDHVLTAYLAASTFSDTYIVQWATSKSILNGDYLVLNSRDFFGKICEFVGEWLEKTTYKSWNLFLILGSLSFFQQYNVAMPRGEELSSFKIPGVGNLLHSCKKNTNPGDIARGGW
jgi:hypothetical protein